MRKIKLEFGGRNIIAPGEDRTLKPYIADELPDLRVPEAIVRVFSPARTFWEKATLIHVACNRADPKGDADRQSRHWYDLAILADHEIGRAALADRELLDDVVRIKSVFFRRSDANYDARVSGALRLIPPQPFLDALQADHDKMIADGMFGGQPPTFDSIIVRLQSLQKQANGK